MVHTPGDRATLHVVHETADELVVWKPAGVASELTTDREGVSLLARLKREFGPELRLCHRLDRPTQGFLVVARSKVAAAWHGERLRTRSWRKFYVAKVGDAPPVLGRHRRFLRERGDHVEVVTSGGQPAWLEILEQDRGHVLVELLTGRRHQVRVMLAALGAPLVGDRLYGGRPGEFLLEHAMLHLPTRSDALAIFVDPEAAVFGERLLARASEGASGEATGGERPTVG